MSKRTKEQARCLELAKHFVEAKDGKLVASYLRYAAIPEFDKESTNWRQLMSFRLRKMADETIKFVSAESPFYDVLRYIPDLKPLQLTFLRWWGLGTVRQVSNNLFCDASSNGYKKLEQAIAKYIYGPMKGTCQNPLLRTYPDPLDKYLRSPKIVKAFMEVGRGMCKPGICEALWKMDADNSRRELNDFFRRKGFRREYTLNKGTDKAINDVEVHASCIAATLAWPKLQLRDDILDLTEDVESLHDPGRKALWNYITLPVYPGESMYVRGLKTPAHAAYYSLLILNGKLKTDRLPLKFQHL